MEMKYDLNELESLKEESYECHQRGKKNRT